ncbi:MAG: hypothetical protein AAF439_12215 [Pseudomonadota bacterium]
MLRAAALAVIAVLSLTSLAGAQDLTADDRAAMEARVQTFQSAMANGEMDIVLSVTPPKIYQHIAAQAGVPLDLLKQMVKAQIDQAMQDVSIDRAEMDLAATQILTTPDGTVYALVPTHVVMQGAAGKVEMKSETLAMQDEGNWWMLRVSDVEQVAILKEVYPSFANVSFPRGSMKLLD